jgi:pimeloyl-ACP methyl ester carboxylesterase
LIRWFRKLALFLIVVVVIFSMVPYMIPVDGTMDVIPARPFEESQFYEVNDISLHYRQWIPAGRPLEGKLLLIHGLGGSTFSWRKNVEVLRAAGFAVVTVDLPGFGYSDRKSGINHSQASRSQLLWQLLDHVDENMPEDAKTLDWVLAGHSMGGGTAAAMTMSDPDRAKALVLIDGAVFDNAPGITNMLLRYPPAARWLQVFLRYYAFKPERIGTLLSSAYGQTAEADEVEGYLAPFRLKGTTRTLVDLVRTAENEPVDGLIQLEVPIYGIWGSDDTWVPMEQGISLKSMMPRVDLNVIDGAVHCPMESHPEVFNEKMLEILRQFQR